jgi:hypothetical protein
MVRRAFVTILNFHFNKRLFNFCYSKKGLEHRQNAGNHHDHLHFSAGQRTFTVP